MGSSLSRLGGCIQGSVGYAKELPAFHRSKAFCILSKLWMALLGIQDVGFAWFLLSTGVRISIRNYALAVLLQWMWQCL